MVKTLEETVTCIGNSLDSEWFKSEPDKDCFFALIEFIYKNKSKSKLFFSDFRVEFPECENLIYCLLLLQTKGLVRSKIQFVSEDNNRISITFDYVKSLTKNGELFRNSKGDLVTE